VDRPRHHFFPGAGFAQQQRGPSAFPEFVNQAQDLAGPWRLSDHYMPGFVEVG
jgi:hypothetical protein